MGPLLGRGSRRGREASCWIRTGPGKERSPGSGSTVLPGTDRRLGPQRAAGLAWESVTGERRQQAAWVEARRGWLPGEGDPAAGRAE